MGLDEWRWAAPVGLEGFEDYGLEEVGIEVGEGGFGEVSDQVVFVLVASGF